MPVLSLVDLLRERAQERAALPAYTFLADGEQEGARLTYGELDLCARAIAARLQEAGAAGERALLLYPPGLDFVAAFFGCLYAGAVAVPAYPPRIARTQPRLRSIAQDAHPRFVLTTAELAAQAKVLSAQVPELQGACWLATDALTPADGQGWAPPAVGPHTLAFLQYTSGSTAAPKGTMVSHGNLLHNEEMIRRAFGQSQESVIVGWLPLYHDMGLIGNVLQPLYVGARCVLMSPVAFLQRPLRWLAAISRHGATTSGGPNFAYDLCVRRIPEREREGLDLSRWKLAYNGSEPVRAETLERFAAAFGPYGFDRRAFYPCYGLAEATLFVSGGVAGAGPVVQPVSAAELEQGRVAPGHRALVGCGRPWSEQTVLIADPATGEPCAPDRVGEIWVAGDSIAQGYWNLPEATATAFQARAADGSGPYLRTGDLGFLHEGELFVTGRLKDLIIVRGRNLYPQDLELTAERSHAALRPGCGAAFAVDDEGGERLVLVHELERDSGSAMEEVAATVRQAVAAEHEVLAWEVVFLAHGSLPKTSSGKIQRQACKQLYLSGGLETVGRSRLEAEERGEATPLPEAAELPAGWLDLPLEDRRTLLEAYLAPRLAAALRLGAIRLDPAQPLTAFGLDSLSAVEIQSRLEEDLGVSVGVGDLLQGPTLAQLAAALLDRLSGESQPAADEEPLEPLGEMAVSPLSHGQRALWFLQRLQPSGSAYNIAAAVRVGAGLDPAALRRAFELLADRHEALRFAFEETPAGPTQRALPERRPEWLEEDARGWSAERLSARLHELAHRPFDLAQDPLLRVAVFRTAPEEHAVLLVVHHIVADLASLAVLVRDLGVLYPRLRLPEARLRYTDWIDWQNRRLAGEPGERLWAWWRESLAGDLPVADLPADFPRPPLQTFRGGSRSRRLAPAILDGLRAQGATLHATLLALFAVLLHRYSGQSEILVGSPTAGRGAAGLADLVGYFVNPVVLRADLAGRPSFRELLERARGTALGAFLHQDYPFPLLVERLQPQRDPSRSPLFQVMLVLERSHLSEVGDLGAFALGEEGARLALAGLEVESLALEHRAAQLDLELAAAEADGGLGLVLIYNADLFEPGTADRLLGHLEVLAAAAVADPARRISELPLLTDAEQRQLLDWNGTAVPFPLGSLPELFAEQAERTPGDLAAVCEGQELTYGELHDRASRMARGLLEVGLEPEQPVAVWAERGLDFLAALLGILQAGGAYLPLDPRQPERRLAAMVRQSGAPFVLVSEPFRDACAAALADGPGLLSLEGLLAGPAASRDRRVLAGQLAYVLYTSGSTGAPKGAMLEHRGMVNHLFAKIRDLDLTAADRVAQTAAPTFDISVWQLLAALLAGGVVEILPDEIAADPARLLIETERRRITILETVPSLMRAVLQETGARPDLSALRWLIPTGEALPPDLARQWHEQYPEVPLLNAYGPTECSDDVTHHALREPLPEGAATTPIGRPVANLRLHVVDRDFHLLPVGVPGELCVAGVGVGRGYLGDPARTAEAFVPDPWPDEPGGRLYRTGDLGRRRPDGALEYLGRLDHQVKVRGFRIELGEIEAALAEHPGVAQAVVAARPVGGEARLAAWWTGGAAAGELRDFLRQRLPEAMIPSAFVHLAALPLNRNGKVDRKALPEPDWSEPEAAGVAPRDEIEELLAGIVADVLGRSRIGIAESFFDAGGHSLLATRVVARVRQALGVELALTAFFEEPTVAGLAARVRAAQGPALAAPRRAPRTGDLPLSFGQQRLWFLQKLEPESPAYNMPGVVRFRGGLRPDLLREALRAVVRRHEALRTVFREQDGEPRQEILADPEVSLPVLDLSHLPAVERDRHAARLAAGEARRPFDLGAWPLFRTALLRLGDDDHLLVVNLHHVISDGWSQGVLVRELSAVYGGEGLAELPLQYVDYARWQRGELEETLREQLAWWRERLGGAQPSLELPVDRPRPLRQTYRGARRTLRLGPDLADGLRQVTRGESVTPFMALLALFEILLHRWSGQSRFNVGTPVANRRFAELEGLIGFFVNTLVLPADLEGEPSFSDLLARAREVALGAYAHQDLPFERLVEELQPARELSRTPLFQVLFVLQNAPLGKLALPGLAVTVAELDSGTAKFDLTLSLEETEDGLDGWIEHNTDLFDGPTLERFAAHLATLLRSALAEPRQPVADLPLLSAAERQALVLEWNDTAEVYPEVCAHQLVEAQVARTPDAVAVSFEGQTFTFRQINARANQLARTLRRMGVGPDVPVGLCVERSPDLIVAVLAILKAGGGYLPLDPSYPRERLSLMLADALAGVPEPVIVAHEKLTGLLPAGARVLCLDTGWDQVAGEDDTDLPNLAALDNFCFFIFTSGSTGRPKGSANTHRGTANRLIWGQRSFNTLTADDRMLQKTPFSFDVAVYEIFWPLLSGARMVLARPGGHQDAAYLARTIAEEGVTFVQFVPSMIPAFLDAPGVEQCRSLKRVICSGEAMPQALAERFWSLLPQVELFNLYGPSETAIEVSLGPGERGSFRASMPMGRPVANTVLRVLDSRLRPVPAGVPGELFVGGAQVARGYIGRPALTAERFVPDPYGEGERLYRTGDLARYLPGVPGVPSGELEFLGRIDHQVKIRGLRVEMGEIETVLREHPVVRDAVAVVHDVGPGDRRIVGYVLTATDDPGLPEELRRALSVRLPDYMVPSALVVLEAFPLTPSGKVDRKALPAPQWVSQRAFVAPRTPVEEVLAETFAALLQVERVGVEDDFFELGGHSLLAARLVSRVREALGLELPVREVFAAPTVAALARAVEGRAGTALPPVERLPRGGPLLQSFSQARLWFLYQLAPQSVAYNVPVALRFAGPLDVAALAAGVSELVRRHEVLRSTYDTRDGEPVQIVGEPAPVPLPEIDLSALPPELRASEELRLIRAEAREPFDLWRGPVLRTSLLTAGPREHVLLMTLQHIAADGWSMGLVVREMEALYPAFASGLPSPLPELPVQFADFAAWQRKWLLESGQLEAQLVYWREQLRGAPALLDLATDRPRPEVQTFAGARRAFAFSPEESHGLHDLSRAESATLYMTLLAAFQLLLSRHSGQRDVLVGGPIANRRRAELEDVIGFFANTVVLRTDLARVAGGNPSFRTLLAHVREMTLGAFTHQDLPFEKLVEELQPERKLSHSPLFQVLYVVQNTPYRRQRYALPDLALSVLESEDQGSQFDITLALEEDEGQVLASLLYSTELFDEATIDRLWRHYRALISGVLADPSMTVAELPELDEVERQALLMKQDAPPARAGRARVRALREAALLPSVAELRQFLLARLPEYMVPSAFVFLDSLPLTYSGKRDLRALPAPEPEDQDLGFVAPRTPTEELLAGIVAALLKLDRVGVESNLFELGGHSMLVMQLLGRIRDVLGVDLTVQDVFEAPTAAGLAVRVDAALQGGLIAPPPITPVDRRSPLPLSFAQQRLWFIDQLEPGRSIYNMPVALRAEGPLDADVLALALGEVLRRHEALRTDFAVLDGMPVQVIRPAAPFALAVVDLSGLPESPREALVLTLTGEEADRPFDLGRGPLLRGVLLRLAAEDHVVALTMHHIASDGWSVGILIREVTTLYTAFAEGRPSPLPALPVQYADFAVWQASWLQDEVLEREISFWRRQLAGLPPRLELPTDRPRPAVQSFRGAFRPVRLPAELNRQIQVLGLREGATLFMVLMAGFQALLARYSGQEDLAAGTPVAGRNRVEIEGLIGFFVNTLVLRGDLAGGPSFRELLGRVRATSLAAHTHQNVPFEKLVQELTPERSLAHSPLFQVMLVLQNAPAERLEIRGLRLRPLGETGTTAKFDLLLSLEESNGELVGTAEYASDLFDAATIDRFLQHFEILLAGLVAEPGAPAFELPLLAPVELQQIREWNTTPPVPASDLLHRRFEAQAARTPRATALIQGEREMTYAELDASANQLGHFLKRQGVGPGMFVGVCLERSFELVSALLGTVKAGGCYVPLDPAYPSERWTWTLQNAGIRVLLTQESLLPLLPEGEWTVLCLDRDRPLLGDCPAEGPPPASAHEDLLFAIYTSGSTGRPKGAVMFQRSFLNLVDWYIAAFGLRADDSFLLISSIAFDLTQKTVFAPLVSGGRLVIPLPGPYDPAAHIAAIERHGVTRLNCTPSTFYPLLDREEDFPRLASLRALSLGGEPISLARLEPWRRSPWCHAYILNTYGPTECTDLTSCHRLEPPGERALVSIGRPLTGVQVWVLARELVPVPVGVTGQMYAAGINLTAGYLGQPAMTAERFLPNPFSAVPGERMYWLGDLGRWLPSGELEYLGRGDFQIKLRGFRIEPAEIEAALAEHPAVHAAVVMARSIGGIGGEDKRLVAWLAVGEGPAPEAGELRSFLAGRLPDYMIPAAFVPLASLPLTPSGKVDRRALPEPEATRPELETGYVAPRTPEEAVLAEVWAEVLAVDRVGVHDHFFDLGGHSLLATQVMSRLRSVYGVEMPLRDLFEAPTLAGLAARIDAALGAGAGRRAPALVPLPREGPLPLSFAQQRLWFIDQLVPGSALYNMPVALRLEGPLDVAVLAASLGEVVRRHEAVRTVFAVEDGAPVQVVQPAAPFVLPIVDLSGLPESRRQATALALAGEEARRPFDLAHGPLLRSVLLRLAGEDHVVALTLHHIASDGWSQGILVRETSALYQAFLEGRPAGLPELPIQYADYAVWQRSWLQGEALEQQLGWWTSHLAGAPAILDLPADRPRPNVRRGHGGQVAVRVQPDVARELTALSRVERATPFMLYLAAFQALLGHLAGREDLVVGTPIAGRNRSETEDLIGLFVNTLALRGDLSDDPTFPEHLRRVREASLGAHAHQNLPFERLVDELAPERNLTHTAVFQALFVFQNAPFGKLELPGLTWGPVETGPPAPKFDLTLTLSEEDGDLVGHLGYDRDLFDDPTVLRWSSHLAVLLEGIAREPQKRLWERELLSAPERHQLLQGWNDTFRGEVTATLHGLFATQARRTPQAVALRFEGEEMSYGELDRRSNQMARYLRGLGVGPDVLVGLCMERSLELMVALLGILKAGGGYVPLDPGYPPDRLAYMVENSNAPVLLSQERLADRVPETGAWRVFLDADWARIAEESTEALNELETAVDTDHLLCVLYTSGSTGRPKGVMDPHRSVVNQILWLQATYGLDGTDRLLQKTPISWDVSLWELFWGLVSGATLVIARPGGHQEPDYLAATIAREGITMVHFVPSMLRIFLDMVDARDFPGLRRVVSSGEALTLDLEEKFFAGFSLELHNMYGPGESARTTLWKCERGNDRAVAPIGRPTHNVQVYVLDRVLAPVPSGVTGELYVGGQSLSRGYYERPDLTAEKFLPHPFGEEPGLRLYRTGDLGRTLPDGTLEFLGRIDHQVKIRGVRIELGEIESILGQHAKVKDAVVVAREVGAGEKRLAAYVVPEDGVGVEELRKHLRAELPDYMVPESWVFLDALPLAPNGKADRERLPEPQWVTVQRDYAAPRDPVEELLASIWADLLGVDQVGAQDTFFELGGNSLIATQMASRVRSAFGVEMPLRTVFTRPTLAELAASVSELLRREDVSAAPPLVPVPRTEALPLSFAQQRLWFIHQFDPGSASYNVPRAVRLTGALQPAAFEAALSEVVRRHEVLRATFPTIDGLPTQSIAPARPLHLPRVDLSNLPEELRETETARLAQEEARRPFDLGRGPLLRSALVRRSAEDHVLLLTLHHIVSDGWSTGVLVHEMSVLYRAFLAGRPSPLPELPIQYADFAHWQRRWLAGEVLEEQLSYWRRQLAGLPDGLDLPLDRPRPALLTLPGGLRARAFPESLRAAAHRLGRERGATFFMVALAAFAAFLSRITGQDDVVAGSPIANRNRLEIEGLIGFFVNTLVLRVDASGSPSFAALLERVREVVLGASVHQDLPFERLVDELVPERNLGRTPLFQVLFVVQNAPLEPLDLPGLSLDVLPGDTLTSNFDLTLALSEIGGVLEGTLEYRSALFDATTIDRFLRHFETLLESLVREPEARIAEAAILTPVERQQIREWNTTPPVPASDLLHWRFEAQTARTPQATALVFGEREMTYAELNARANQLAHHLTRRGVGPGSFVGVCLERSFELVVSLLGTLKAGGCYVPLDPAYPSERWTWTLQNAGIRVLLTQESLLPLLPEPEWEVLCLDSDRPLLDACPVEDPPPASTHEDLLFAIYTSGSTGRPKGAAIYQRSFLNLVDWYIGAFGLREDDSFLLISSIAFDLTQKTVFSPLVLGGRLVIPLPGPYDPVAHVAAIERHGVTRLNCTPSTFYPLLDQEEDFPRLASLRGLSLGGEPISLARLERWRRSPWCRAYVLNTYGPTECTDLTSCHRLEPPGERDVVPIGWPLTGVQVWVLSRELVPVPVGVTGQMYAAGIHLTAGYLGQPAMTAERFLPNPFSEASGERMYWLGDLGRWLPSGELEYLGRGDFQIKLRGFRIEPAEIEGALAQHPAVREAVVMARGEENRRLVAWLAVGGGPAPEADELRSFLAGRLPDYMIPSAFVPLAALPLTPSGKVDRRALPEPEATRPELGAEYVAPRTLEEEALAEVWAEVLEVDRVGVHDNFFALGGDSIRSVRVLSLARARGLDFSLPQLFQHQTIAELVPHRLATAPAVSAPSGPLSLLTAAERAALPPDVEDAYPLSALQLGMLFHSGFGGHASYQNAFTLRFSRVLDTAILRAAAARLAGRHPVLRTSFDLGSFSRPLQLVHRTAELPVTEEDLGALGPAEREAAVSWRFEDEKTRRFDLDRPPLLRFHVQHLGGGETQFFWAMHHVILDGWSMATMLAELFQLYRAELEEAIPPPAPVSTFREFIALEREVLESDEAREFWTERLRDAEPARLLPWHPEEKDKDRTPVGELLPEAVLSGLRELAAAAGVPQKSVFLAAQAWAVGRLTGTRDVILGLVTNGRPEAADADRVLGLFLNTVPLRIALSSGTWLDLVRDVFEAESETLPFRRYPLAEIQRELGIPRLFETSCNYVNFHVLAEAEQESGLQLDSARSFGETSIPLTVDFAHDSIRDTVLVRLQRDSAVVNQDQLRAMLDLFQRVLAAIAAAPEGRYDTADLLSPAERQQVLHEWNDTALVKPLESELIHGVFEHWVATKPDAPALRWSRGELTYRELNRRANRIARRLQASGAGPEVAVGLYVERSPEMIAGMLGIWKSGATYVPLDPSYPRDRLLMMIEDVHMPLALVQERLAEGLSGLVGEVIALDDRGELGEAGPEDDANPASGVTADNLAYAIFTSGSTGRPKPVGVPHRGLTHHAAGTHQLLRLWEYEDARMLLFSTLNFDGSLDQLTIGLLNGFCLVLREEEMWSAEELEDRIAEYDLTFVDLSTGYWSEWVRARSAMPERAGGEPVRLVYLGGEAMMSEELAVWWKSPRNRNVRLLNAYGPTETVIVVSALEVTSPESAGPMFERVPIGRSMAERALHVVDADWRLSPVGVTGELLIAGEHTLARGYLGRPDLTAERFLPDPFSPAPGARLYRTGDLGRYLPDGRREFLGRIDDQVKIRGFRIELGEVEGALMEHEAVYRAVAVTHGKQNDRRLVAYVTFIPGESLAVEELRAFLRGKLPEPMVPSEIVILDRLPLTPTGKVDRRALPVPELSARRSGAVQAPSTDLELQLVAIWEELLDVSPIGVTDDFLELGGHSLLAVRLMARIEHVFGVKLPISALFEASTVERLAAVIQRGDEAPARRSALVRLHPGGAGRPLFVVHPVGGDVFAYVGLARRLGTDRPVYGLQAVAEGNGHQPTLEELAAQYLAAVREVQPEGPYLLAGWSLGAVIAYEMAQQIERSGGTVALLAMIDPSSPDDGQREGIDDTALLAGFAADLVRLSGRSVEVGPEVLEGLGVDAALDRLVELGRGEGVLPPDVDKPRLQERFKLFGRHVRALQGYVPRPYGGRIAFFRASASVEPGAADPTSGWSALARAEAHLLDADHYTLLQRPALERLVEQLRSHLTAAEGGQGAVT